MSEKKSSSKKNSSAVLRLFKGILLFITAIVVIFIGLCIFCEFDKKEELTALPSDFSVYVKTESAFGTLNPLLDLNAADVAFAANADLRKFRSTYMTLRSSPLRKNALAKIALSRPASAALYSDESFLAIIDLGFLSILTRPLPFFFKFAFFRNALLENGADIKLVQDEIFPHFSAKTKDEKGIETETFFVPVKNLILASSSLDTLMIGAMAKNEIGWSENQKKLLDSKTDGLKIIANAKKLAQAFTLSDDVLGQMASLLPETELSVLSLKITDSEIKLNCALPISPSGTPLDSLLAKKSSIPEIISKLGDVVQYYTILNAGTLQELKEAVFPLLPEKNNPDSAWKKGDFACRLAFGMSLDELLFSWTGNEFAALGIENQNDPVFAVQISDEKKRRDVFEKFISSIFIKDDNSLILGGVRLPRLKLPSFLDGLISLFGIEIPSPYYLVLDNFIYFSESPESLSAVFNASDGKSPLLKSENWKTVSASLKNDSSVTLFYDLEKSLPFFIRKNADFADVLKLYTLGRFDAKFDSNSISISLQASSVKNRNLISVPGFPISVEKTADSATFAKEGSKNPQTVFWAAKGSVNALDILSLETKKVENVGRCALASAEAKTKNGVLWAASESGNIYLCEKNLSLAPNFPVILGERTAGASVGITAIAGGVLVPLESGKIAFIDENGHYSQIDAPAISLKSRPAVFGDVAAVYDKSFFGGIYLLDLKNLSCRNSENPLGVEGIGFGSPALLTEGNRLYTAFVTQAGLLTIWENDSNDPAIQKQLEGNFTDCLVASGGYFFALSTDAVLHRISVSGEEVCVQIPHATAKNAHIAALEIGKDRRGIFVNADSNVIYAFGENMELLKGFPLTGSGRPAIIDVNGDNNAEMLSITLDKKIAAWKLR